MTKRINKNTPWQRLKELLLQRDIEAELELVQRILEQDAKAIDFFLNHYSVPVLDYIGKSIFGWKPTIHIDGSMSYCDNLMTDYYSFIAHPFLPDGKPTWRPLSLFESKNNAHLYSYLSTITVRYFYNNRKKYQDEEKKDNYLSERIDNIALHKYIQEETDDFGSYSDRVLSALQKLNERDRLTLELLVIQEVDSLEAFEELKPYINARSTIPPEQWDNKRKQDAVGQIRRRAEDRFREFFKK